MKRVHNKKNVVLLIYTTLYTEYDSTEDVLNKMAAKTLYALNQKDAVHNSASHKKES